MKRKRYSSKFKAKVALEAIRGMKTINELSTEYGVHPNQIRSWKKQSLEFLPEVFSSKRSRRVLEESALRDSLYQQIGRLQMELEWLKKKSGLIP